MAGEKQILKIIWDWGVRNSGNQPNPVGKFLESFRWSKTMPGTERYRVASTYNFGLSAANQVQLIARMEQLGIIPRGKYVLENGRWVERGKSAVPAPAPIKPAPIIPEKADPMLNVMQSKAFPESPALPQSPAASTIMPGSGGGGVPVSGGVSFGTQSIQPWLPFAILGGLVLIILGSGGLSFKSK
jgi:hypothetical protein